MNSEDEKLVRNLLANSPDVDVEAAKRGDPAQLIARVLGGGELSKEARAFIAEVLETVKSKRGAQYDRERELAIFVAVRDRRGVKREATVAEAMDRFRLSRAQVRRILKDSEKNTDAMIWRDFILKTNGFSE